MIQVSVLTGFLGSGKTTLLGHLLRQPQFSRTAVIINEFGEVGLDHELVEASEDSFIELQTGCLCCKIRTDLAQTLQDLLQRRDRGSCPPFDRIVIETSGLADPAPILQTLMTDIGIAGRLVLGGMVTTVDAVNGAGALECEASFAKAGGGRRPTCPDQNRSDRRGCRPRAAPPPCGAQPRRAGAHGRSWPDRSDHACSMPASTIPIPSRSTSSPGWPRQAHGHSHDRHDADIKAYAIVRAEPIRAVALTLFLEALAEHCGADLLRLKGIVNIAESPDQPAVIHGVQHVFHPPAWLERWPSDDRRSRIVFIARRIPQRWVEVLLDAIGAEVADVSIGR